MRGKIVKLSALCKIISADRRFYFCFLFFRSVDLNKVTKRCLNVLTLNLSYMWAWSLLICLGLFGQFMYNSVCQEIGTQSTETVKLRFFLHLSRGDSLEIGVFYSILGHICKKNLLFSFHQSISVFPCYIFFLSFPDSHLSLEGRNETLKTPN